MGGESKSKSQTTSTESSLLKTQESILQGRNNLFQTYFVPEFKQYYSSLDPNSKAGSAQMGLAAKSVNQSFDAVQRQTDQQLAQRNMLDSGAGMALTAANNRARSGALADAYAQQMGNSSATKGQALSSFAGLMPQTTTAAPVLTNSSSKQSSNSSIWEMII